MLKGTIKTKAGQRPGFLSKSILVETDSPDRPALRLYLKAMIVVPVEVRPATGLRLHGLEGTTTSHRVLLHRRDGQRLQVEDISLEGVQGIEVSTRAVVEAEPDGAQAGDIWLEAHFPGGSVQPFSGRGLVHLKTNYRRFPSLEIPITVSIRRMVECRPKRVWIQAGSTTVKPTEGQVILSHSKGLPLRIKEIHVSPEDLSVRPLALEGRPSALRLIIGYADLSEAVKEPREGLVRVELERDPSEAAVAPLEIPVTIMPMHQKASQPARTQEPPPSGSGS
jgi:hypothetical protein